MPYYDAPNNDVARSAFLTKTVATAAQDTAAGNTYVFPETVTAVQTALTDFDAKLGEVNKTLSERATEVQEQNEALVRFKMYMRDMWEVVKRRVRRQAEPASVLTHYQLPLDGTVPKPQTVDEWFTIADAMIKGDANAVTAGYAAAVCPSAVELQTVLDAAKSEAADVSQADRVYDQAQKALADLRSQVDELIAEVVAQLRFQLRKEDAPGQRRIMRTYGARFRYLKGEPVDPDDTTPVADEGDGA